jgi:hypothetical protein
LNRSPEQERAVSAFLDAHRGLFVDLIRPYTRRMSAEDAEELMAEAEAEAARGFESWRADHPSGALPETLATRFITGMLANRRRGASAQKAQVHRAELSLETVVHRYDDGSEERLGDSLQAPDDRAEDLVGARMVLDCIETQADMTLRQREVWRLMRLGYRAKDIAAELGISDNAANTQCCLTRRSARRALGVEVGAIN